ncbi:hypothetical protein ES703_46107 [subsurface metagenome]
MPCGLSLGCFQSLIITLIEKMAATFKFIVVAAYGLNIEDVIKSPFLVGRSYIGAKSFLSL